MSLPAPRPTGASVIALGARPSARGRRGRRDRHGRGARGPLAWPRVPAMRHRRDQFDDLVLDALEHVERRVQHHLDELEVAVEDVPPSDPSAWEPAVPLGRAFPPEPGTPPRLVVYRRPVTSRCADQREVAELVLSVVTEQVASLLGLSPDDLED